MTSNLRYRLTMKTGPAPDAVYDILSRLATIGRYAGNTITIPDEQVSRHHARLTLEDNGFTIEDLNSANGVFVNGERITAPRLLKHGDRIRLGESVTLVYEAVPEEMAVLAEHRARGMAAGKGISDKRSTVFVSAQEMASQASGRSASARRGIPVWVWVVIALVVIAVVAGIFLLPR